MIARIRAALARLMSWRKRRAVVDNERYWGAKQRMTLSGMVDKSHPPRGKIMRGPPTGDP